MMTPEQFANDMKTISENYDIDIAHRDADTLMCRVLREHGYQVGVDIFEAMNKWYA